MLLPHGFEGAGPEHSVGTVRALLAKLCAEHNMQICIPSTPAQVFHMLRRQVIRPARKPLVALTPKSLLRHNLAVSTLEELCDGEFQTVLDEIDDLNPKKIDSFSSVQRQSVLRSIGSASRRPTVIPWPSFALSSCIHSPKLSWRSLLSRYSKLKTAVWCQEEPMNQGAWYSSQHHIRNVLQQHISSTTIRLCRARSLCSTCRRAHRAAYRTTTAVGERSIIWETKCLIAASNHYRNEKPNGHQGADLS